MPARRGEDDAGGAFHFRSPGRRSAAKLLATIVANIASCRSHPQY
jgi:hypothetical protein